LALVALPGLAASPESSWRAVINPSVGAYVLERRPGTSEATGTSEVTVTRERDGKRMRSLNVEISDQGWIDFVDLDGDGYKDLVVYPPGYGAGPLPSGDPYVFDPKTGEFESAQFVGGGLISVSRPKGCVHVTNRMSSTVRPNYITARWCFDRQSRTWRHKADYYDLPDRGKGILHW